MKSNHSKRYKKLLESSKESKAEIIEDVIKKVKGNINRLIKLCSAV